MKKATGFAAGLQAAQDAGLRARRKAFEEWGRQYEAQLKASEPRRRELQAKLDEIAERGLAESRRHVAALREINAGADTLRRKIDALAAPPEQLTVDNSEAQRLAREAYMTVGISDQAPPRNRPSGAVCCPGGFSHGTQI